MELTPAQGRVLGALVEKERTTPQAYPLTDNALLAACNQTTSRDPVVGYDVGTVRVAVRELRELGLVRTVHRSGERTDKHRHELQSALGLSPAQVALLAVLLLRGPQTLAELRARCERLEAFATVDDVERELAVMADRDEPLVGLLPRQPGRKEARFGQLLAPAGPSASPVASAVAERTQPQAEPSADRGPAPLPAAPVPMAPDAPPEPDLAEQVADLADEVALLRDEVSRLRALLEQLTG
jgi:uncharacterized protein YceH (UPF0502 family)